MGWYGIIGVGVDIKTGEEGGYPLQSNFVATKDT